MAYLNDVILSLIPQYLIDNGYRLDITSAESATYTAATVTNTLGNKTGIAFGAVGDRTPNGRKVTVTAITGGSVTGTATATHWAICTGTTAATLLATGLLATAQSVTNGNTFSLAAFDIGVPDAT